MGGSEGYKVRGRRLDPMWDRGRLIRFPTGKPIMKRSLIAVLLLALATVSFVGCGGEEAAPTPAPAPTTEPAPAGDAGTTPPAEEPK
jgi:hypothetical protein